MTEHHNCVYRLISPSGKSYVGQCLSFSKRMKEHESLRDGCPKLCNAIKKYGWENFEKKILLEDLTLEEMNFVEEFCISVFDSIDGGYNITCGGYGVRGKNGRHIFYGSGKYGVTKDDLSVWRKARYDCNHDSVLVQQRKHYHENEDEMREKSRKSWAKNKDKWNANRRDRYAKDSSKISKRSQEYYLQHKEEKSDYNHDYYSDNHDVLFEKRKNLFAGCNEIFAFVSNKDAFRRVFVAMFGGGRTRGRIKFRKQKYNGKGAVDDWGDWLWN